MGALTPLYAATSTEALEYNGKYFGPWARPKGPRIDHEGNVEAEDSIIAWLEEQILEFETSNGIST
ncbi:hypothetical protein PIIN_10417 [Serendipita indica DSM 11827]|nr:hypothetical protein PIIN_10417 [Serendipita indica DSM 11827]